MHRDEGVVTWAEDSDHRAAGNDRVPDADVGWSEAASFLSQARERTTEGGYAGVEGNDTSTEGAGKSADGAGETDLRPVRFRRGRASDS